MTDDKMQPNVNDRPAQEKSEQVDQQAQQRPASAAVQPGPQTTSGRKPLFGN